MSGNAPIDCEEVLRHLFAYLDGELEDGRQQQIRAHLELCRGCFSRMEFESRLKAHLRDAGRIIVPPEVERRVRSVLDELPER
jgi:anti-sigma factor (TIGR02949 family)